MDDLLLAYGCSANKRIRLGPQNDSDDSEHESDNDVVEDMILETVQGTPSMLHQPQTQRQNCISSAFFFRIL